MVEGLFMYVVKVFGESNLQPHLLVEVAGTPPLVVFSV